MAVKVTCEQCGAERWTTPKKAAASRFCGTKCSADFRRGKVITGAEGRRYRYRPDHPLARFVPSGHIPAARIVLYDKIGEGPHPCHWCNRLVFWRAGPGGGDTLVADHVNSNYQEDSPDNLVPACQRCNGARDRFIPPGELFLTVTKANGVTQRTRAKQATCLECGGTFLLSLTKAKLGYGQFCGRPCAARNQFKTMGTPSQAPDYVAHNAVGDDELFIVHGGVRERAVQKNCRTCGKEFLVPKYNASKGGGKYCSHTCVARRDRSLDKGR